MPARNDPAQHGRRLAQRLRSDTAEAILTARLDAGISQATAGSAAGMSHAQFGRIEGAELRDQTFEQASRAASAVGLRLSVKTYPDGDPARDGPQLAVLERFRRRLPPKCRWNTEVCRCPSQATGEPGTASPSCVDDALAARPRLAHATSGHSSVDWH